MPVSSAQENLILNFQENTQRKYMDFLNVCTYHRDCYTQTKKITFLVKSIYYGSLAFLAAFEGWIGKWVYYSKQSQVDQLRSQIKLDLELLPSKQIDKICRISAGAFSGNTEERLLASQLGASTYATTYTHFAPVIYDWTLSLLARARESHLHLVFMARDGKGAYLMAKKIQEQIDDPDLNEVKISYVYLSRKVVHSNKQMLERYLRQELGNSEHKNYLFLDLGFLGSMVDKIHHAMKSAIPDSKCDFEFLISTGNKVRGFAGSLMKNLQSVRSAGKNRAVYWMEDTHQGTEKSPSCLVETPSGKLVPNTVPNPSDELTVKVLATESVDFLCRETALQALVDFTDKQNHIQEFALKKGSNHLDENLRKRFDNWLNELRKHRFLYIKHT